MEKISKKIVFFGNERLATGTAARSVTISALLRNDYSVAKIYTKNKNDFKKDLGIPISTSLNISDIAKDLEKIKPDIGVLVAYGLIIPEEIINIFPYGIINIHPSLLPKGRGPSPIEETILKGSKETGVSIMRLAKEMDSGPILSQQKIKLKGNETKQYLADLLLNTGSRLLIECLSDIFAGKLIPKEQSDFGVTYSNKIKKADGIIDWEKPAIQIEREIRAYAGWPKSRTLLNGLDCIIIEAEILDNKGRPGNYRFDSGSMIVFTGEGSLRIKRLQPAGKKEMATEEFLRGYGSKL